MFLRIIFLLGLIQFGCCQFFNLGAWNDLEPFGLLNNNNNNNNNNNFNNLGIFGLGNIRQHHGKCSSSINGISQDGNCLTRPECSLNGGQVAGRNGCALGVCCVYSRGCSQTSSHRVTYFQNSAATTAGTCQYTVRAENNNICQMRLDFENFAFPQPTQQITNVGARLCRTAYLEVTSPNNGRIPPLCGNLDGQHIYVPVNASLGQRQLVLNIVNNQLNNGGIGGNNGNGNGLSLNWRIKVTQLECPTLTKAQKSLRVWEDSLMIAPDGCLQYHTEQSGRIRNLGYDLNAAVGANFYQANLNYAICFKRSQDSCGVTFNVENFILPGTSTGVAADCTATGNAALDADYLYVINGRNSIANPTTPINQNRYCGNIPASNVIQETTPGPLYIFFRTDAIDEANPPTMSTENGWVMTYNVLRSNNC